MQSPSRVVRPSRSLRLVYFSVWLLAACETSADPDRDGGSSRDASSALLDARAERDALIFTLPDAGPPIVHDCASLGDAGEWQNIPFATAAGIDVPVGQVVLTNGVAADPRHAGVVYVGLMLHPSAGMLGLWRTEDCGASWTRVATGTNADAINSGMQYTILFDPRDPDVIISQSFYGTGHLYRSQNRGVDWEDISPSGEGAPSFVQRASMDPSDPDHLLVSFHEDCTAPRTPMCLAETLDGGARWRLIDVPLFTGWAEGGGPVIIDHDRWLAMSTARVTLTEDAGATWEEVLGYPGCNPTMVSAAAGEAYLTCNAWFGIQRSTDFRSWELLPNSPGATALITTGSYLYASFVNDTSGQPIHRAPIGDPTMWERVATPAMGQGANAFTYDPSHHVLYGSSSTAGLWRVVTD